MSDLLPLSVLDLFPVVSGTAPSRALRDSVRLARRADELGYTRYWVAEHHNMPGIASAAPEVLIAHLAQVTRRIRVGSLCRKLGVTATTFYRWKAKFGGMEVSEAKQLRALEDENRRLKALVADLSLDNQMLKAISTKKW